MKVGRDIVALSIPFSAGVALAAAMPLEGLALYLSAALCGAAAAVCALLYCRQGERLPWGLAVFFFVGALVCFSARLGYGIDGARLDFSSALQALLDEIDSLSFEDVQTRAIAKALLTGQRGELSKSSVEAFRSSGAAHILSLSGLHMGIIYGVLQKGLSWMGRSPVAVALRAALVVAAAAFYAQMTGGSPSVVRAFLFIVLNELSRLLPGRQRRPLAVLCCALLLQLLFNPLVIKSVGFQLSYSAMLGVFLIFPRLDAWYTPRSRVLAWIWKPAALSISCQITTAPLSWLYFKTFPWYFLLSNLVAIPLAEGFVISLLICLGLSAFGICPDFLVSVCEALAQALLWFLSVVSKM